MNRGVFALLIALFGCNADPPPESGPGQKPDAGAPQPGGDAGNPEEVQPPTLAPLPATTYWSAIPVHGHGPAGGTILIQTEGDGALARAIAQSGDFCVDVPLQPNEVNHFQLRAQDANGILSESIAAQVQQQGDPPPPPMVQEPTNVSLGGAASTSTGWLTNGSNGDMIDGNAGTSYSWKDPPWGSPYAWVQLSMRSNINHIRVHSNSDCILHQYDLMASDRDAPGNPTGSGSDWFRVGHMDNGTGDDDFMFNMAEVMHVAVKIESDGCGNFFGWRHDVSEIEVWTAPNAPPPPPQPPTCAGGGG